MNAPSPNSDLGPTEQEFNTFTSKVEVFDAFILGIIKGALANLGADNPPPICERVKKEPVQNKPCHDMWFQITFPKLRGQ